MGDLPAAFGELKKQPVWVVWRWQWKVNDAGEGHWSKPPYRCDTPTRHAQNNDPKTWGSYERALAAYAKGKCEGIGINLLNLDIDAFDLASAATRSLA